MDELKYLIIVKENDKTKEVKYFNIKDNEIKIKYKNNSKEYSYNKDNIIIKENGINIDFKGKDVYYKDKLLFNIDKIIKFEEIIKILYKDGSVDIYMQDEVRLKEDKNNFNNVFEYFKEITKYVKDGEKENNNYNSNETFLEREYKKINSIDLNSVLYYYINKIDPIINNNIKDDIIYPFGFNISQKKATENVYKSNISVIEGPPGTGKTQTILNIISNLAIMQEKTVAVVSNNNEAVKNVSDKLLKNGYGFITANLGKDSKRKEFFLKLPKPDVSNFYIEDDYDVLLDEIKNLNKLLDNLLEKNNIKSKLESEIESYKLEQKYFNIYYEKQDLNMVEKLSFYNNTYDKILEFLIDFQMVDRKIKNNLIFKLKMLLKYGIKNIKKIENNKIEYILNLQKEFYDLKIKSLEEEYDSITNYLDKFNFNDLQDKHKLISTKIFQKKLYDRFNGRENSFDYNSYKEKFNEFIKSFPIILSTTYSLRNCIPSDFMFDYVIIDESSQVDLLAGSLALSCAKNVVIVGDTKQLPQIVDKKIQEKIKNIKVDDCHNYFKNNLLSALVLAYKNNIIKETLKEHYRCHPKIIGFCNQRYYDNKLICFTSKEHKSIEKPLILYYTSLGNHMRKITKGENKGNYNQRELDVIKEEVLKDSRVNKYDNKEIGITTPYRLQADKISKDIEEIQSDTIHKYQGREKDLIILSTVLDSSVQGKKGIKFVDDPCMINVAVSRAVKQFVIVTDNKLFNYNGEEIKSLIKYIKYNNLDSEIINSDLVSVFDLLYKEYSKKLEKLSKKLLNKSKFKSENIIDTILYYEFKKDEYKDYIYRREYILKNCIVNFDNLTKEEENYINNGCSVDFVILDKMNKKPLLFIEVDGFSYHENNPKQLEKDKLKDSISKKNNIALLRLKTNGTYSKKDIISSIKKNILN